MSPLSRRQPARWPMLCPACNVGQRGDCDCPSPGEAATDIGAEPEAPSVIAKRLRARAAACLAALGIAALYAITSDPPPSILGATHLPGDGFPAELLATFEPAPAASEVQP